MGGGLASAYRRLPSPFRRFYRASRFRVKETKIASNRLGLRLERGKTKIPPIERFEVKIFSQEGEDGIISAIFCKIGTTNKFCVEFGVGDGHECNTRYLIERKGWRYLHMEGRDYELPHGELRKEFITAENINSLFEKYGVPQEFDLLSIDIDYNDYWVWKAVRSRPRVVVIEYNSSIPPTESRVVEYDPTRVWDRTNYFGASILALKRLGQSKGYNLIGCESNGVNAFFVRQDLAEEHFETSEINELFRPPKYGEEVNGHWTGHPKSSEEMISI